jgi:hypothetical protein
MIASTWTLPDVDLNEQQRTQRKVPIAMSMLELSTRPWLYSLSLKYQRQNMTLDQVPDEEWQALLASGHFDMIWLMGVWALGPYGLNYDRTNPDLQNTYNRVGGVE